jgi:hypothetical protein
MKKRRFLFPLASLLFFAIGIVTFIFFGKAIQERLFPPKTIVAEPGGIARKEQIVTCNAGDTNCEANNTRIEGNNIPGDAAAFVRHQCDGPRACPTPNPQQADEATKAIKGYAKDTKLDLVQINGISAAGVIYYCAKDARCWSYNTKTQKVEQLKSPEPQSTTSIEKQ